MAYLMSSLVESYEDLMEKYGDPRTKNWFLMGSPFPTLFICITYAYVMRVAGPRIMENRKPYQLRKTLIVYNFIQVILSTWLFHEGAVSGWFNGYSLICQPVDYSDNPNAIRMARCSWFYFMSKFFEFCDTLFFVLRKKNRQISTLHIIHHGVMPLSVWFGVKFTPGGHASFFGFLNSFVHIIMYAYYLLAAFGPRVQKYLWWKKYLTSLQMIQFVLIMLHAFQLLFVDCNFPKAFVWWIGGHSVMFYFLFSQFYNQTYNEEAEPKKMKVEKIKKEEDEMLDSEDNSEIEDDDRRFNMGICFTKQSALYDCTDNIRKSKKSKKMNNKEDDNERLKRRSTSNKRVQS